MPTGSSLLDRVLTETIACQNPVSPQSQARNQSAHQPFGPNIPGPEGSYPTTDAAMDAIAQLGDMVRAADPVVKGSVSRDHARMEASRTIGDRLEDLIREPNAQVRWRAFRDDLKNRLKGAAEDLVHYVPVWLFLDQSCPAFSIGPVKFIERDDWL